MLIAMIAGTVMSVGAAAVACPPDSVPSEGNQYRLPQVGQIVHIRMDEPSAVQGGGGGQAVVVAKAGQVSVSEAPYGEQFTDAMLNKVWVSAAETATLKEFAAAIGKGAEREVFVDWERLKKAGLNEEMKIATPLKHVPLESAMRIVNERMGAGGRLAVRRTGELVEISTQETFDRREKQTVAYDVRALLKGAAGEAQKEKLHEIAVAMTSTIDPEGWTDNGGDTSRQSFAEGKLFVVAPPRVQKAVAWFFGQVSDRPIAGAEALHRDEPVQVMQIEPVQINSKDMQRNELEALLKSVRRELAWKKVALGEPLTAEDQAAMDDARAVHAVEPGDPQHARTVDERKRLASKAEAIEQRLATAGSQRK